MFDRCGKYRLDVYVAWLMDVHLVKNQKAAYAFVLWYIIGRGTERGRRTEDTNNQTSTNVTRVHFSCSNCATSSQPSISGNRASDPLLRHTVHRTRYSLGARCRHGAANRSLSTRSRVCSESPFLGRNRGSESCLCRGRRGGRARHSRVRGRRRVVNCTSVLLLLLDRHGPSSVKSCTYTRAVVRPEIRAIVRHFCRGLACDGTDGIVPFLCVLRRMRLELVLVGHGQLRADRTLRGVLAFDSKF